MRDDEMDELGELTVDAYRALGMPLPDSYEAELRDVRTRAAAAEVIVAVDEDGLLGGVTFVPGADNPLAEFDDPDASGFRMLGVAVAARGRGAGEALVRACIDRARALERRRLLLHTTEWMKDAHRLYERLGFRRDTSHDLSFPDVVLLGYTLDL